jgi:cell division protein FtsW (lipid II flippase)
LCVVVIVFGLLLTPVPVHAQTPCNLPDNMQTELGCIPTTPAGFVQKYYGYGLGLIGGVATLFIIYGGYIMMMSQGNPTKVNEGKSYLVYSFIGLLLAVFGYVFVQVILVDVLHVPGFS